MNEYQTFAHRLNGWGFNVTAIAAGTKRPGHEWIAFQDTAQDLDIINGLPWLGAGGVGGISGVGGLRVFDFDKCEEFGPVATVLSKLGLPADYSWVYRSGSGHGWGVVVRCFDALPSGVLTTNGKGPGVFSAAGVGFDHLELRYERCQTLFPPSKHPTGPGYRWLHAAPTEPPAVVAAAAMIAAFQAVTIRPEKPVQKPGHVIRQTAANGYALAALRSELDHLSRAAEGTRNNTLNIAALHLGELVAGGELARGEVEQDLLDVALRIGLGEREAAATINSGLDAGAKTPRKAPETKPVLQEPEYYTQPARCSSWLDTAQVIGPIVWEWPGWLASALLALLVGESGTGKSILALRIAATYLLGWPWPDGKPFTGETGKVLWCEAEAAQAINLERAQAWGLPIENILSPFADPLQEVDLGDAAHLAAIAAGALRDDVRLIVVDSLSGASGGKEKGEDMMPVVKWLAELARNVNKPVLLLHHLRKRGPLDGAGDAVTLDRVRGSTVIIQPARVVWALDAPNKNDSEHRRLSVIKSNLGRFPEAVGLRIDDQGVQFDEAPTQPKIETQTDRACDLLRALLADGPVPVVTLEIEAKGAGISWDTFKKAREALGIVSHRDGNYMQDGKKVGRWVWGLPTVRGSQQEKDT